VTRPLDAAPTGVARRRPRLSDAQTERRMLDAGLQVVDAGGFTVSLEHLGFEEVIASAGVSRASAYRRWPHKDLFLGDLLLELARATDLADEGAALIAEASGELADRAEELLAEPARTDLVVDVVRRLMEADAAVIAGSQRWRTYVALHVTFAGLPDGDLRRQVAEVLVDTERQFTARRAEALAWFAALVGYRLVPGQDDPDGFRRLAFALGASATGVMVRALADPALLTRHSRLAVLGTSRPLPWTEPALLAAGVVRSYLEPDPDVVWDRDRVDRVRASVESGFRPAAGERPGPDRREGEG
jgi:AcrR family transcriptional regulator